MDSSNLMITEEKFAIFFSDEGFFFDDEMRSNADEEEFSSFCLIYWNGIGSAGVSKSKS
jgi:hypothetical protein